MPYLDARHVPPQSLTGKRRESPDESSLQDQSTVNAHFRHYPYGLANRIVMIFS